jgi:uncharacterized protein YcbK (DUF882 family)
MCELCDRQLASTGLSRRSFIAGTLGLAAASFSIIPAAQAREARSLSFYHTHTGRQLRLTYAEGGQHIPEALDEVKDFLRDFRTGEAHPIDPELLDLLHQLRQKAGGRGTYEIISAFRSPHTNEMLRSNSGAVAQRSLHMEGKAIDVRLRGVPTRDLREHALSLKAGGVGYYQRSDFIHVDTGRVRFW